MNDDPAQISHEAWDANAQVWDARMGDEGNDFFNVLCWPAIASFLDPQPGQRILDIACGNGLTSVARRSTTRRASPSCRPGFAIPAP